MPLGSAFVFIHIIRTQGQPWSTTFPFVFDELDRFEFNSLYRITNHDEINIIRLKHQRGKIKYPHDNKPIFV